LGRDAGRWAGAAAVAAIVSVVPIVGVGATSPSADAAETSVPAAAPVAAPAVKLPAPAAVGQQTTVATRIGHTTAAGTFEVEVSMTSAVTAVNAADGPYTTRSTIGTFDVPVGQELAGPGVNALVTRSFEQSFTATGAAIPEASTLIDSASMTTEQQDSGRALVDAVSMISVGFPVEPVAVGAAWSSEGAIGSHGSVIPVTYQCRLTALDAAAYMMEVTYTEVFSLPTDAGMIEATVAGMGTIAGSVSNPLAVTATLNQTIDGIQGAQPLHVDTSIAFNGTGG
jgi:hypothetical protein